MAIKQRKQLTGTTAQINAYAGVEGQLVWDKTKKKWVGMSGTAGTNYPMASESHTHSISNVTNLQSTLDGKATTTALTAGLAGKANKVHTHAVADVTGLQTALDGKQVKGDYATSKALTDGLAGKANKAHTHAVGDVTGLQASLDAKTNDATLQVDLTKIRKSITDVSSKVEDKLGVSTVHITKTWKSTGGSWYREWSDGFIEQGGVATVGNNSHAPVTFPHPFSNTYYSISGYADENKGNSSVIGVKVSYNPVRTNTSCGLTITWAGGGESDYMPKDYKIYWVAVGY